MKKFITLFIAGIILLLPTSTNAVAYHSYGVTSEEKEIAVKQDVETRNIFEELEYRMLEKDEDYDFTDYMILAIIIILIVVVIAELNRKTYVIVKPSVFEEPTYEKENFEIAKDDENVDNTKEVTEDKPEVIESEEVSNK